MAVKKKTTAKKTATKKKTAAGKRRVAAGKKAAAGRKPAAKKKTAAPAKKKAAKKKAAAGKKAAKKTLAKRQAKKPAKKQAVKKAAAKPTKAAQKTAAATRAAAPAPTQAKAQAAAPKPRRKRPGGEYMNPGQVEHFRGLLNDWKQSLMEEVERTVHDMQDEASNFPDPNDRATQEEEFALKLRTRDRERKLIKKINESLLDLDSGDYGYCEVCGVEIGLKRLEARPTATLCIDCKTLDEIKEKQLG